MRILLVNAPWSRLDSPSLALGIIKNAVVRAIPDVEVEVLNANLDFVDWVTGELDFTLEEYNYFSQESYFSGFGDWVFSSALYEDQSRRKEAFRATYSEMVTDAQFDLIFGLYELTPAFIVRLADQIAQFSPDLVGFTTTFQQNAASLAVAKQVKRQNPDTVIVMGGANCDGTQGAALHAGFDFIDFVVRGEGELAFPALVAELRGSRNFAGIAGLCWRDGSGTSLVNAMQTRPLPPDQIVGPDFSGFYERLRRSVARRWVEPRLAVEGSRGCWWGAKHHCTFCGLNGTFMEFRSKAPADFYQELIGLAEQHGVLDFVVVDNIMDMGYITSLLPRLIDAGYDFRLFFEIKANLRLRQLDTLMRSGVVHVQPGIENLSNHVLKLMNKGVTGCQNVRMLRDSESLGMSVEWNYLYGFPDEVDEDYQSVIRQMPALHHLQPAVGSSRIAIERFSPYFNRPELGFSELRPDEQYGLIYDLPDEHLFDLAYLFRAPKRGIGDDLAGVLDKTLTEWRESYNASRLSFWDLGEEIVLANRRSAFPWSTLRLEEPVEVEAFRLLDQPHSAEAIGRKLRAAYHVGPGHADELLRHWQELGLVFSDGEQFVQIATMAGNQQLLHAHALDHCPVPDIVAAGELS
ncbi:RiPP maturation radical SAM C-methyltransferase [Microbispora sp. NEAU-D428]|uniref:RiPP maturation radical SAM C-methyltransferase n=1 Tax=Microbispora sitophila TaxID=2771537 RepID=UPI001868554A|nr:RiPP maturation radical SAM C-methyltransferase [Microbispora sitophila]MBE3014622.1 RiPP maturation radical SAM C-methyltransferase [Microbispora sitophila]